MMTRNLLALMVCCAAGLLAAFAPCSRNVSAEIRPNTLVAEVPIKYDGPMPVVEVMVNGKGPFKFGIDTGSQPRASVNSAVAETLGLPKVGQVMGGDPMGRNPRTFDIVKVELIKLASVEFRDVEAVKINFGRNPRMANVDGILGAGLFADYLLTLDYPAGRVRVERGELPQPDGASVLSYQSAHGIPSVEISFGELKVYAHVDTGNLVGAVMLPSAVFSKLTLASEPRVAGRAHTVSSEIEIREASVKETMRLGGYEFQQPTVSFSEIFRDANIGLKLLKNFAVTLDQKNMRMRLVKAAAAASAAGS